MKDRQVLIDYIQTCIEAGDWHAVSDAANDLREDDAVRRARGEEPGDDESDEESGEEGALAELRECAVAAANLGDEDVDVDDETTPAEMSELIQEELDRLERERKRLERELREAKSQTDALRSENERLDRLQRHNRTLDPELRSLRVFRTRVFEKLGVAPPPGGAYTGDLDCAATRADKELVSALDARLDFSRQLACAIFGVAPNTHMSWFDGKDIAAEARELRRKLKETP